MAFRTRGLMVLATLVCASQASAAQEVERAYFRAVAGFFQVPESEIAILSHRDTFRRVVDSVGVARILDAPDPAAADTAETMALTRALHAGSLRCPC